MFHGYELSPPLPAAKIIFLKAARRRVQKSVLGASAAAIEAVLAT
jgi:hypothetical protein